MVYGLILLTIVVYFLIIIRIFYGINDVRTVSFVTKLKGVFKTKDLETINTHAK
ncbi:hypothetical protein H1D32_18870 [Anaerobacillus sp. CMMVII]|uniref:hypothetical protein n=1 Tax=Anaerobacillus sp. CMMVII TaxID=2755588 RepID=UPI0021B75916|nr:hypothetical protein [Anaerobacillus sp. CMMVII]MCT8139584.1 hypothetical protein [Anaerobacillus sp. CMMVII]